MRGTKEPSLAPILETWSVFWGSVTVLCGLMYFALMRGFSTVPPALREDSNDLEIYRETGEAVLAGRVPYRDFFIEYPPGSIPSFVPPALFADGRFEYINLFAHEMALVLCASLVLVALAARRLFGAAGWLLPAITFASGAALLYPVAVSRYDPMVTLSLAAAVFFAALGGRYVYLAYASLGLGAAAKLIPALAAFPLAAVRGKVVSGFAVCGAIGVLLFAPALYFGGGRFIESFTYHTERGIQLESVWAAALIHFGLIEEITFGFGAYEVAGSGVELASSASLPLTAALLVFAGFFMYREHRSGDLDSRSFPKYAAIFVLSFMVASKVLSPQYMLWLLPLVPLVGGKVGKATSALFVVSCLLTTLIFPINYTSLVELSSPGEQFLVARNLLLVAMLVLFFAKTTTRAKS